MRSDAWRATVPPNQVGAGQLAELHAEQWSTRLQDLSGVEMGLHDLTGCASRECVAFTGQVSAGNSFGDRSERIGDNIHAFETTADRGAR